MKRNNTNFGNLFLVKDGAYGALKSATETDKRILWHYTDWSAFESILRTDELWAFDYRFMNDSTELSHSLQFCKGKYAGRLDPVEVNLISMLSGETPFPAAEVLSTSLEFDSLEQWRGYSRSSVGVALAFDREALTNISKKFGFGRLECAYVEAKKLAKIEGHIVPALAELAWLNAQASDTSLDDGARFRAQKSGFYAMRRFVGEFMSQIVLAFKDESFSREQEVRFVSNFRPGLGGVPDANLTNQHIERGFKMRGPGVLAPYTKISLAPDVEWEAPEHPLVGVLLGPVAEGKAVADRVEWDDMRHYIKSVAEERFDRYSNLAIACSKVPLRT